MTSPSFQYIESDDALEALCDRLVTARRVGLDTEFVGEETFVPRLELVQIASDTQAAVIDVRGVTSLTALARLLGDPTIEKILHAGRQDLELLRMHTGVALRPFFDTQIAAAMVGYGAQIGYAQLVRRILGRTVAKAETMTNWGQRPLSKEQLAYAGADVSFLLPLHSHLVARLDALNRHSWAREEFEQLAARPPSEAEDPRTRFERIRGWEMLKPKSRAVLRELAAWRESEARRRNLPRGRIVRDDLLMELSRRLPTSVDAMRAMRGISHSLIDRHGVAILDVVRAGLAVPPSQHPQAPTAQKPEPDSTGRVEVLQAVLKACAQRASIASTLLATSADLQALVQAKDARAEPDLPLLKGWRRRVAGDEILDVLGGNKSVRVDSQSGRVRIEPTRS